MSTWELTLHEGDKITLEHDQYMPVTYVIENFQMAEEPLCPKPDEGVEDVVVLRLRVDTEGGKFFTGQMERVDDDDPGEHRLRHLTW